MSAHHSLADVAALIGEPTRAAMLVALLSGQSLPASELARSADLSAAATSLHLAKLVAGGLLEVRRDGRYRYYRLAGPDVVHALEALGVIATAPPPARSASPGSGALRTARTCYDHLAGTLGVSLADSLVRRRALRGHGDRDYSVTASGARWLAAALEIDVASLAAGRRPLARRCLDWTERRPHVAGALGAALLDVSLARRWIVRTRESRAVRITLAGHTAFAGLGVNVQGRAEMGARRAYPPEGPRPERLAPARGSSRA